MIAATQTQVKVMPLEDALDAQIETNDILLSQNYLDFQDYCNGQLRYIRRQPFEWCENDHERRGWLDAMRYGSDCDTEAYLAEHPVEVIETDW